MQIKTSLGTTLEVEDTGSDGYQLGRPVVLLIMGLGMQLTAWPLELVQGLVDAGYRVLRFDNRDVGLSEKFDHLGQPPLLWSALKYKLGLPIRSPYTLSDMADDALGVLDALRIAQAHVLGVSMGGMIAQRLALAAPQRVLSLSSVMSSSGARKLPPARPEVLKVMMGRPKRQDPQAIVDHYVRLFTLIGSPAYPQTADEQRSRIAASLARGYYPAGTTRQMLAVAADSRRAAQLAELQVPTLVLHGKDDPLLPYACGEDTARRIPGAKLVGFDGMGHDLPPAVVELLLPHLLQHFHRNQPSGAQRPQTEYSLQGLR